MTSHGAENGPAFVFRDGAVHATIDVRVYRLVAVQKTAYRLAEKCTAVLGIIEDDRLPLTLVFARPPEEGHALEVGRLFFQELLDQELREQVGGATRAIRSLLLAQAFSKTDLIDRDDR